MPVAVAGDGQFRRRRPAPTPTGSAIGIRTLYPLIEVVNFSVLDPGGQ